MILVDSHCHLDCLDVSQDGGDISKVLARANANDVHHFLCVSITQAQFPAMFAAVEQFANVSVSIGTHPNEVVAQEPAMDELIILANHPKVIAIGETGLDYYRSEGDLTWQRERFRNHIRAAKHLHKPLIVHSRQAREDTIQIMREENAADVGGVLHCFTENWAMAEQALALNFYISFSGIITFNNAKELREVVKKVPIEKMLIETDSPYLAPVPFRGKSNEPAYVRYVAEEVAALKGLTLEEVAHHTTKNYFDLFKPE